jgi:hypothetical protein
MFLLAYKKSAPLNPVKTNAMHGIHVCLLLNFPIFLKWNASIPCQNMLNDRAIPLTKSLVDIWLCTILYKIRKTRMISFWSQVGHFWTFFFLKSSFKFIVLHVCGSSQLSVIIICKGKKNGI